jgi:hypothetical protein
LAALVESSHNLACWLGCAWVGGAHLLHDLRKGTEGHFDLAELV